MKPFLDALDAALQPPEAAPLLDPSRPGPEVLQALVPLVASLSDVLAGATVAGAEVPFGRYLAHLDPAGRFNLQWDVFSPHYRGGIHAHGTWGCFFVLRGTLYADDFSAEGPGGPYTLLRTSAHTVGSAAAFAPPQDWHRVSTRGGPQVMSLHLYGPGFDLDRGVALDASGQPSAYTRGPFGNLDLLEGFLSWS
jgi:predicted metal-dependent enzyme (double-stranded beta helix superfamily)